MDPTPPRCFQQCAGFINTPADDVAWNWEDNCAFAKEETLFIRVYDDTTGALLAGARLFDPLTTPGFPTGRNYRTSNCEGEGLLDNPLSSTDFTTFGTSLFWHDSDIDDCRDDCGGAVGVVSCNDIFTANAANDKGFYVGGNSVDDDGEATWGPAIKDQCPSNAVNRLRVAIYAPVQDCALDVVDNCSNCSTTAVVAAASGTGDTLLQTVTP